LAPTGANSRKRHAPFALQADIDDHEIIINPEHDAGNDGTFKPGIGAERGVQEGGEIIGAGIGRRVRMAESG
jgi:hypothetical protein